MVTLQISRSAKADLLNIAADTLQKWGIAQAERYLDGLEQCAIMLAENPSLGRLCEWIRPGLHRFEKGRHVVFYRRLKDGIVVSRILHQSALPDRHPFEDEAPRE